MSEGKPQNSAIRLAIRRLTTSGIPAFAAVCDDALPFAIFPLEPCVPELVDGGFFSTFLREVVGSKGKRLGLGSGDESGSVIGFYLTPNS